MSGNDRKLNNPVLSHRIGRLLKSICAVLVCIASMTYIFTLNVAYAVSVDGEFIGYAESVSEIDSVVESVNRTASEALGYEYSLENEVSCRLTIATADEDISGTVETMLLDGIDEIGKYAIVSADGVPFCAFESSAAAAAALSEYTASFTCGSTVSSRFLETVKITVDYADTRLLEAAADFNSIAAEYLHVETVDVITEKITIPCETEYVYDDTMFTDESITDRVGIDGICRTVSKITSIGSEIQTCEIISSETVSEPVSSIIRQGTVERLSEGSYIWPAEGLITSEYGPRSIEIGSSNHHGIDIASAYGTPIYAADGGRIICSEYSGAYGYIIKIQHDNGDVTFYAHCSELLKEEGETVSQGELIARMGATGQVTGVHLHFEYHPGGGYASNPRIILP